MGEVTTLRIHKSTKRDLDKFKVHPREPYEEVLERLMKKVRAYREGGDPREEALNDFVKEIKEKHGDEIKEIILYGSYARGEPTEESDIDILIIWKGELIRGRKAAAVLATKLLIDRDILISPKVISPENYERMINLKMPFMENVQKEGIKVG